MKKMMVCLGLINLLNLNSGHTCTRATYLGPDNTVITARSMDWPRDMGTSIWIFPRGMMREGSSHEKTIRWKSIYGSIVVSVFDGATADGMNEKGFAANLLYLSESEYPKPDQNNKKLPLSIAAWAQYVLDNFATVEEAVKSLRKEPFYVVPVSTPDGEAGTVHLAISDVSGDSAIFEYIKGKLVIHHGRQYQVMTNSPSYEQQLALDSYWKQIGGMAMLPGTSRAADRFARASYYLTIAPQTANNRDAIASVFSIIRNVSTPMGVSKPGEPSIAPTLWRTVLDQKNKRYYFESTRSLYLFWTDLADINWEEGQPVKKLALDRDTIYAGNVADKFQKSEPFKFLSPNQSSSQ